MSHYSNKLKASLMGMAAAAMLLPLSAGAVKAYPGLIKVTQPDGSTIQIRMMGDERFNFILSEDGYLLVNKDGGYYFAESDNEGQPVASPYLASPAASRSAEVKKFLGKINTESLVDARQRKAAMHPRNAAKSVTTRAEEQTFERGHGMGIFPNHHYTSIGKNKALVILVEYKDVYFYLDDPFEYFNRLLNEPGFSDNGATGSAIDYFRENSNGKFEPEFDVYGPVRLDKRMSYYGGNINGFDGHPEDMILDAIDKLDEEVDFSQYDTDGDGVIDNVFVFYAGLGEATSGVADTVWPHQFAISKAGKHKLVDGVKVDKYACSNEWRPDTNLPDGVGTFIHEYSHVLGLPDLYTTSYNASAFTPGSWSILDQGSYNNKSRTPPAYSIFERNALKWMTPFEIAGEGEYELPIITEDVGGVVCTSQNNEIFLFENRQQVRWDEYIPGHGMVVWHIHYVPEVWDTNVVNDTARHQYVDMVEADNTQSTGDREFDTFPGLDEVTTFGPDTKPALRDWNGYSLGLTLTDITETPDKRITFKVSGNNPYNAVSTITADKENVNYRLEGKEVYATRDALNVYDTTGARISYIPAGCFTELPSAGLYIISDGKKSEKIMVK